MDRIETSAGQPSAPEWPAADWLGFDLPKECVAGVAENLVILSGHMKRIRGTLERIDTKCDL